MTVFISSCRDIHVGASSHTHDCWSLGCWGNPRSSWSAGLPPGWWGWLSHPCAQTQGWDSGERMGPRMEVTNSHVVAFNSAIQYKLAKAETAWHSDTFTPHTVGWVWGSEQTYQCRCSHLSVHWPEGTEAGHELCRVITETACSLCHQLEEGEIETRAFEWLITTRYIVPE